MGIINVNDVKEKKTINTIICGRNKMTIKKRLIFICGLCSMESERTVMETARYLKYVTSKYNVDFIFKVSIDKANRTSLKSFRGLGFQEGMDILRKVKKEYNIPILTDIHHPYQAEMLKDVVDIMQIPAFLCRQTDLVVAVGRNAKMVNIKKGQFLAPEDMRHIITKIKLTGNKNILLTERGTCFGYHNLIVDPRSFLIMKKTGYPVIFDVTHSQQKPSISSITGGSTEYVIPMAQGAVAMGVDGLFVEVHPEPKEAKCDRATALHIGEVEPLLKAVLKIREVIE